jgi:CubicO group peptidase (beta-lactamase class C family)
MMYPRGERFQYNNTGYVVLGLIIEAVAKMPFDEYLNKAIFTPCNMADTGYPSPA